MGRDVRIVDACLAQAVTTSFVVSAPSHGGPSRNYLGNGWGTHGGCILRMEHMFQMKSTKSGRCEMLSWMHYDNESKWRLQSNQLSLRLSMVLCLRMCMGWKSSQLHTGRRGFTNFSAGLPVYCHANNVHTPYYLGIVLLCKLIALQNKKVVAN